jgi:ribosome-associated translation inhibitor RaiA
MNLPLQITFRGIDASHAIEDHVRRRAEKLDGAGGVVACRVAIEAPHRSKTHGRHYRVRLDIAVAGGEIIVDRCPDEGHDAEDVHVAIDRAFDHAVRRLREHDDRRRATP